MNAMTGAVAGFDILNERRSSAGEGLAVDGRTYLGKIAGAVTMACKM